MACSGRGPAGATARRRAGTGARAPGVEHLADLGAAARRARRARPRCRRRSGTGSAPSRARPRSCSCRTGSSIPSPAAPRSASRSANDVVSVVLTFPPPLDIAPVVAPCGRRRLPRHQWAGALSLSRCGAAMAPRPPCTIATRRDAASCLVGALDLWLRRGGPRRARRKLRSISRPPLLPFGTGKRAVSSMHQPRTPEDEGVPSI